MEKQKERTHDRDSRVKDAAVRALVEDAQGLTGGNNRCVTACSHVCKCFRGTDASPAIAKGPTQLQSCQIILERIIPPMPYKIPHVPAGTAR